MAKLRILRRWEDRLGPAGTLRSFGAQSLDATYSGHVH